MDLVRKGDIILVEGSLMSFYLVTWIVVTFNVSILTLEVLGLWINADPDVAVVGNVKTYDTCLS